jgi:NADPH-dependent curcumin reductase CurA
VNKQIILAERPEGLPSHDTWRIESSEIPKPKDGEFLLQQIYISLDPAMRGWITDRKSYLPPVQIDAVMRAASLGKVIVSNNSSFPVGSYLYGTGGVQQYIVSNGKGWYQVDEKAVPLPVYLSALGMTGFTAYFGLLDVGEPKEGETILVSGAAGAVGSMVGQIGKIKGCRVVGIAGGPEKCKYVVEELGFDACIDYKNEHVYKSMKKHCPDGIDIYFDNVGGQILDYALAQINLHARVVICGAISQYNNMRSVNGPANYLSLLVNRARMEGFVVIDYYKRYGEAAMVMGQWLAQGKIKTKEHIEEGIENFQETLMRLFNGDKRGKLILKIDE